RVGPGAVHRAGLRPGLLGEQLEQPGPVAAGELGPGCLERLARGTRSRPAEAGEVQQRGRACRRLVRTFERSEAKTLGAFRITLRRGHFGLGEARERSRGAGADTATRKSRGAGTRERRS